MSTMKPLLDLAQTQEALQEIEKKYDEGSRIAQTWQALEKNESIARNKDVVKGYYKGLTDKGMFVPIYGAGDFF